MSKKKKTAHNIDRRERYMSILRSQKSHNKAHPNQVNSHRGGFIRVRLKTIIESNGEVQSVFERVEKKDHTGSICVFIAGGVSIDEKVARANAAVHGKIKA